MRGLLDIPESLLPVNDALVRGLARVEQRFDAELASDLPPVMRLVAHVERYRGKMLRPTLVLLAGLAAHPSARRCRTADQFESLWIENHIDLAAVVEMVHMATLVHDDVLDEAEIRRRGRTVNNLEDNETAVILGDYLIAAAYRLCARVPGAAGVVGDTAMVLCGGELLQLSHRGDWSLDDATYYEIVARKTGALIGCACALGAASGDASPEVEAALRRFGERAGVAFQIQDDLLDLLGEEGTVGKSVRRDLAKGKLTLPFVHALAAAAPADRGALLELIEAPTDPAVDQLVAFLRDAGSLDHARAEAAKLIAQAKSELAVLPEGPVRQTLEIAADAVAERRF